MNLLINQEASVQSNGWWQWAVWLEGPDEQLDQVESVDYVLHSSFHDPIQHRENRAENFRLDASGWGEFLIHVHITLHDGEVIKAEHWLELIDETGQHATEKSAAMIQAPTKEDVMSPLESPSAATSPARTHLFLSCSLADQHLADEVGDLLKQEGIDLVMADEYDGDLPLGKAMQMAGKPVLGAVFFVSDVRSPHIKRELDALPGAVPVVPVLIGDAAKAPAALMEIEPIRVGSGPNDAVVREIAGKLIARFGRERR